MVRSSEDKLTQELFKRRSVRKYRSFERVALRRLLLLDEITSLRELKSPGLNLEALTGNRAGQQSIRINDKWRVCFRWVNGEAHEVEIVDYH